MNVGQFCSASRSKLLMVVRNTRTLPLQ